MPDEPRGRYLAALDELLPMPPERRAEILEEIDAHLTDAVAERVARGEPASSAEASAEARLGSPVDLARDLARPEQSAWRVFAGVGAALRGGIGYGIYGYLFGTLVVLIGVITLSALVQAAGQLLGTRWSLQVTDQGWNTMLSALAGASGLYFAGRVLPDRLARGSGRLVVDVRPWVVAVGTLAAVAFTTLVVEAPQNWASVVVLALTPGGIALGSYRPDLLPGRVRLSAVLIVVGLLVLGVLGLSLTAGATGSSAEVTDQPTDRGLAIVGPAWHPVATDPYAPTLASSSWGERTDDMIGWEGELAPGVSLTGFTDLRLEAWRSLDGFRGLDPAYQEPFATAPVSRDARTLSGRVDTSNEPGVVFWDLILTGVRDDGVRYVIDASGGGVSSFSGSVWDWIVAVTDE